MGEDIIEFENARREFTAECDAFNAEKKGLNWRLLDAEDKLAKDREVLRLSTLLKEKDAKSVEARKSHAEALARIAEPERVLQDQKNKTNLWKWCPRNWEKIANGCSIWRAIGKQDNDFKLFKQDCSWSYSEKHKAFAYLDFYILKAFEKLPGKGVVVDVLRKVLEGGDATIGDASPIGAQS
ncbi:hypothetical protein Hanom_Chr16g01467671 [Helianthus anomalus]